VLMPPRAGPPDPPFAVPPDLPSYLPPHRHPSPPGLCPSLPAIDASPSWAPDGSKIAFGSGRSGNGDVYVMNANGTGVERLTNDAAIDAEPAWGPSGMIVFATRRDGN